MNKILIIAYFYPPCNLAASQRPYGWTKYLHQFGYYPVVITRNWEHKIRTPVDAYKKSGNELIHEKYDTHEVYYLPYVPNIHNRIYTKYNGSKFVFLRKVIAFFEMMSYPFTNSFIPFKNMYEFSREYLTKNSNIGKVIITGNPFVLFKFGYLLNKNINVKWIADYRDDWNTQEMKQHKAIPEKILHAIESYFEKKWVRTAEMITSVSEYYASKIAGFVNRPGFAILNGYADHYQKSEQLKLFPEFSLVYSGTLYHIQEIEIILDALKKLINDSENPRIKIYFPGLSYDRIEAKRVASCMYGYEDFLVITDRVNPEEARQILLKSHVLLMISYGNLKGVPSSKLYEYISLKKTILLCPSDHDVIESTLKKTCLGYFADTKEEAFLLLKKLYQYYEQGEPIPVTPVLSEIKKLSKESQTQKLAETLDTI